MTRASPLKSGGAAGAKLSRPWRDRPGPAAGAGPLCGRDADRQSRRRDAEGALDPGRRGRDSRRGHARFAHAARPLRDRDAAVRLSRAQRGRSRGRARCARMAEGQALALISDAGTPLISDPGYKLVAEAVAAGLAVTAAPGASAALAALCVAGLPTDRFFFEGFLPPRSAARRERINALAAIPATLVFYEAPSRLAETLADLALELGSAARGGRARTDQAARGGRAAARSTRSRLTMPRPANRRARSSIVVGPAEAARNGLGGCLDARTSSRRFGPCRSRTPRRPSPPDTGCRAGRSMRARWRWRATRR